MHARNSARRNQWLEECARRGLSPDAQRLERVLTSLATAITERGGQRRARPHLDAQLRRLRKLGGSSRVA